MNESGALALSDPAVFVEGLGFIPQKFVRLAEIVKDYDPYLSLKYLPSDARTSEDTLHYAIVHSLPDRRPYSVFYFAESADPADILGRLFAGDDKHGNVLAKLEAKEAAKKIIREKENLDQMMEAHDEANFLWTSRSKNYVNWVDKKTGEKVKLNARRERC